jgi:formamidopyrimidine-DNA glycosylase
MPELPDVETYKRYFDSTALHRRVRALHVPGPRVLRGLTPQALGRRIDGSTFEASRRHGKYLFVRLDPDGWLVLHFGMTGRLAYFKSPTDKPDYTDVLFELDNGFRLAYAASRKLGWVGRLDDPDAFIAEEGLGPDALALDLDGFRRLAAEARGGVKCWLMRQETLAGIGNVYSDEVLFRARLHPKTSVRSLDPGQVAALFEALREVLYTSIAAQADPRRMPPDFLLPHRNPGAHCPQCGRLIMTIKACGRTAYLCPGCQRSPG